MTPEMRAKLKQFLIKHEGYKERLYKDSLGFNTIGIGRNLDIKGALPDEIDLMFNNDSSDFETFLRETYPFFNDLNEDRQIALIDMSFMGKKHIAEFKLMFYALEKNDYETAANEILNSEYAKQVGQRAIDIANVIRTGTL